MIQDGSKIDQFIILSKISAGTVGTVYKVADESGKIFALKVLINTFDNREWQMRFEREVDILKKCDHPSIVKVYSHGTTSDQNRYLVMDYVEGRDLQKLVDGVFTQPDVKKSTRIIRDAAKALEHAHSLSIVHRDIKPANILVRDSDGGAIVVDFGLAKDFARLNSDHTFHALGARGYSCHHKTQDPKHATFSDDIWSLGAVFYFLLERVWKMAQSQS